MLVQELAQVWLDLQSIIWMSYRKDFTPIGALVVSLAE